AAKLWILRIIQRYLAMTILRLKRSDLGKAVFPCADIAAFPSHSERVQKAHLVVRKPAFFAPLALRAQPCSELRFFLPLTGHVGVSVGCVVSLTPVIHFIPPPVTARARDLPGPRKTKRVELCLSFDIQFATCHH